MIQIKPIIRSQADLELKGLGDHHLETDAFIGIGRIDSDHDALIPGFSKIRIRCFRADQTEKAESILLVFSIDLQ